MPRDPRLLPPQTQTVGCGVVVVGSDAMAVARILAADDGPVRVAPDALRAMPLVDDTPAAVLVAADGPDVETLAAHARKRDPHTQLVLRGGLLPSDRVVRLTAHGWLAARDGAARLRLAVRAAGRTHQQLVAMARIERAKTELLAAVSHELRTPLNVILGYVDLLREGTFGTVDGEPARALERVRGNAGWLLDLVEEFLDFAQLEAGETRLRCVAFDALPLLHECADGAGLLVAEKSLALRLDVPASLPQVRADPAKLRVVVQNLLANAVKFTDAGHVRLAATIVPGGLRIDVEDTGPGIPAEQLDAIFDPYHQLDPARGPRRGVGLGLALARRFARLMGGELVASSVPGEGATFTLLLPSAAPAAATTPGSGPDLAHWGTA